MSFRHSPGYMVRELFLDLGDPNDYLYFPERKLTASPDQFTFKVDPSQETLVRDTFESNPRIQNLEAFLEKSGTQAFLVIRDDVILYERYFMGYQRDSIVTSFSVAKSVTSALIGIAIQEGYIKSAEDPITDYIPELADRDPRFQQIQIRHLLMMASGLRFDQDLPFGLSDDSLSYAFDDMRHLVLTETKVAKSPGEEFVYNKYNPLFLGMVLERTTGRPVTTYLQEKLWTPLGMEFNGSWSLDSQKTGFEKMETGINARAIDFAKFGRLYLKRGQWNGTQLVPSEWVNLTTQDTGLFSYDIISYGYLWWGAHCQPENHDFAAIGDFGQFIYVSPEKDLVIVRNGQEYGLEGETTDWINTLCEFAAAMP
jgi:CubicO group peptidase (beta-lactamase class C family)